jgi:predicted nucleic acid-binding protein
VILLDTSALYALADTADPRHREALGVHDALAGAGEACLIHSYVIVETAALLQSRAGYEAAACFLRDAGTYETVWVNEETHREALALFTRLKSRTISLVDCVSFAVMKRRGITTAFAFDRHFVQQGFSLAR